MIVTPQGLNVFPEDVERALAAQPGVKDAAVVGASARAQRRGAHPRRARRSSLAPTWRRSSRGANAQLEDHQRVWSTSIWPGAALPRTEGTQKLKRREIQRWAAQGATAAAPVAAATSVEDVRRAASSAAAR